jgi:hypothetical protein
MATWVLRPDSGNDCCACAPALCDDCEETCSCLGKLAFAGGTGGLDTTYPCVTATGISLDIEFNLTNAQVEIFANGVSIYDSGCIIPTTVVYGSATIPGGTTTLRILITCKCDPGEDGSAWVGGWDCDFSP